MKKILTIMITTSLMVVFGKVNAQEIEETPLDTLTRSVTQLQSDIAGMKKFKFSGYIQGQYQHADTVGAASFAGGDFGAHVNDRMLIRRGRLKGTYTSETTTWVMQLDFTEKGLSVKDAYGVYTLPFFRPVSLTGGIFDRNFGYEISYSSSVRESPERSMIFQTLFPGERDLGAKITFQMPKGHILNPLKFDLGIFNGTGPNAVEYDNNKEVIARLNYNKVSKNEKFNYGGGISYYNGSEINSTRFVYSDIKSINDTVLGFSVDSSRLAYTYNPKRQFIGFDLEFIGDLPIGLTNIRAEYIQGTQIGSASTSKTFSADPASDLYLRNFNGGYIIACQNIGSSKHQIVLKYDWYDPNTDIKGDEIGKLSGKSKTGKADLAYSTIGFGWVYRFDANIKLTLYYDIVKNETSKYLNGYTYDKKDNVFTARVQYKF